MNKLIKEAKRLQTLAGIIKENVGFENENERAVQEYIQQIRSALGGLMDAGYDIDSIRTEIDDIITSIENPNLNGIDMYPGNMGDEMSAPR